MTSFRLSTLLRCANLCIIAAWLWTLRSSGLLLSPELPLAVLFAELWTAALAAFLSSEPPAAVQASLLTADCAAVAFAAVHAQAAAMDLLFGLCVPLLLAGMLLPAGLCVCTAALAAAAAAAVSGVTQTSWLVISLRLSLLLLLPACAALVSRHLLARRARLVHENLSLQRQHQLSEYVTYVLFQLREYMTSITTVVEHLGLSAQDEASKDLFQKLKRMLMEVNSKIVRTVDTVRTTSRRILPSSVECDLALIMKEASELSRATHPRPRVELSMRCDGSVRVQGSRRMLLAVLSALFDNALEAFPIGAAGRIRVLAQEHQEYVGLRIEDDAGGIPAERLAKLFEPMSTSKADSGGIGLGLSMSRRMLESTGGTLAVESGEGRTLARLHIPKRPALPTIRNEDSTWASRRGSPERRP
ncbi:MAG: HAMP domain-containing sensor histidine kinase [Elusimicrobiota bacterium]|jgi:signal transduction histidine kinase